MKTGNRIGAWLLLLTLLLTLAACGAKAEWTPEALAAGQITEQSAADLLAYLTSPVLRGRAVGSDGNVQAAKDIAALFAALGYEPLGEDYLLPYTDELVRQENAGSLLALIAQDGKRTELTPGEDYIYAPSFQSVDVVLPVSDDLSAAAAREAVYCGEDARRHSLDNENVIALDFADLEKATTLNNATIQDAGVYLLLSDRFRPALEQAGAQVELKLNACAEVGTAYNVAAVRRGSSGKTAVVIGAHFDGSGFYGDVYYPSAYDNGSGTTAMLLTACLLRDIEPESDVVFVAFNGEERGLGGSKAFAPWICEKYDSVAVINIDCAGLSLADGLYFSGSKTDFGALSKLVENYTPDAEEETSDHLSFDGIANAFAVNIGDTGVMDYALTLVHTRGDTADKLDTGRILGVSKSVEAYVRAGDFPQVEPEVSFDDYSILYSIPVKLAAYEGADETFLTSIKGEGTVYDRTFATVEEFRSATGIRLLDNAYSTDGISFSVWSQTNETDAQMIQASGYGYLTLPDGTGVSQSIMLMLGTDIDSDIRNMSKDEAEVETFDYPLSRLGVDATIYRVHHKMGGYDSAVGFFTYENILYVYEVDDESCQDPVAEIQTALDGHTALK